MSKAFTKEDSENEIEDDATDSAATSVPGGKNYITRKGYHALVSELQQLMNVERPEVTQTVSWAAGNGDRSENGDYLYGKKRLREIDKRVRFLSKRIEIASIVDPTDVPDKERVLFGATVTYRTEDDTVKKVQIVGIDEADASNGTISWVSPLAKALLKTRVGDWVTFQSPKGPCEIEIEKIEYL